MREIGSAERGRPRAAAWRRAGFTVIGLAAVTLVVTLLALAAVPACSSAVRGANMTAVGARGKDLYMAITGANVEREPFGLPGVWPSDAAPRTLPDGSTECFDFDNSTDYFAYLYDEANAGTPRWNPRVSGFNYTMLAGSGVPVCRSGRLTAACNLWTVAKNVRDELSDSMPVLVTRNVDATSLAASSGEAQMGRTLRFDPEWERPFGREGCLLIRKGGSIFKTRARYRSYRVVYRDYPADEVTLGDRSGTEVPGPLKYLTPTREIVPGDASYRAGRAASETLANQARFILRECAAALASPAALLVVVLSFLCAWAVWRSSVNHVKAVTGRAFFFHVLVCGLSHWIAIAFYAAYFCGKFTWEAAELWPLLSVALVAQASGIVYAGTAAGAAPAFRTWAIKKLIAAPLLVLCALAALLIPLLMTI